MVKNRKLISNSLSMVINRLTQSITAFVLTASIARTLGAEALGQYLLAFTYYFIFVNIASQGLKTLFTREIAREPEKTSLYLISGTWLQLIFSCFSYVVLVIIVFLLPYTSETSTACYIMGLTIIPFSLSNITEAIFQAKEKMHLIALATVPVYVMRLFIMLWSMQRNYGVDYLAAILVISESIILAIEWILITKFVKTKWQIDKAFVWKTLKNARTFFAIEGLAVVNARIQILILSLLGSEFVIGVYGGIMQLFQPFLIVANSIGIAMFPRLSKAVNEGRDKQRNIIEKCIEILLTIGLPLCVGLLFIGKNLLIIIYNSSFAQGSLALSIIAISLIFLPFNQSLSFLLVANGFEIVNLRQVAINTILGSLLGLILVSQYNLLGAAIMALLMSFIAFSQYIYFTYTLVFPLNLWRIIRNPLIISVLMTIVFIVLETINLNLLLTMAIATCCYILFVSLLSIHALGKIPIAWEKIVKK
ncbi:polysaccharide biosynthesis protein [Nostoc linckia z18]|uniref:Polysaccharide biosynthesis protein n=2 Tax=Nostoc linckia TaxID=92942 RepID=A0A9Q6ELE9_NOSLI|nr:oligosaccharide flippase family protein [Nostoc linckia]MBL1201075.1 oligosaccharide flippase family protein [Nostoc sp. GBBB01]PHJ64570.1 polysaccharide biosynthesis protein [Nostoc linckia z1]PHJ72996.1 polysaccharide biosynthesis protein [Nostoc linckia z2]PHJ80633.1 polysaccharide biosynthesis protein [Nostoc linckia z4]PHJ90417.1 polysaccharide biosynthesis protein [Nostoc linckia z6]PHJ98194.1 polysaccharide biosynthesis protein [Nostoc linckia z7]PHK04073.1 polysaccharide biosynthe